MKTKLVLAAFALAAMAAPAFAANDVCLRHHDVDGWGSRDNHSMIVNDRFGRKYLVSLAGVCSDLPFSFGVGFRPTGGFVNMGTCVERGDHVVMRGGAATFPHSTCWVTKVQPYTPDMQQADRLAKQNHQPLNTY